MIEEALYDGVVVHTRHRPVEHSFSRRLAMPLIRLGDDGHLDHLRRDEHIHDLAGFPAEPGFKVLYPALLLQYLCHLRPVLRIDPHSKLQRVLADDLLTRVAK